MRLIKLEGHEGPIYINPDHVVAVRRALRDTMVQTVSSSHTVKEEPDTVARLLSEHGLLVNITPGSSKSRAGSSTGSNDA